MNYFIKYLSCISLILFSTQSFACTGWAAMDANGNVLIAKNRDAVPTQEFVEYKAGNKGEYSYIGLFAYGNTQSTNKTKELKAGVNEANLVVTSLSAKTVLGVKHKLTPEHGVLKKILTRYKTVQEIYKNKDTLFNKTYAMFYMFADKKNIAYVEISPDHTFKMTMQNSGILTHANTYLSPDLLKYNKVFYKSSDLRLKRINVLLKNKIKTKSAIDFTMDDFIQFSKDSQNAPRDSLWRSSKSETRERTVASIIVELRKQGENNMPWIYIKLAPIGKKESELKGTYDDITKML